MNVLTSELPLPSATGAPAGAQDEADHERRRLDEWFAAYEPTTLIERDLIRQAVTAAVAIERCHQVRATWRAEVLRTAVLRFEAAQRDEVEHYRRMFNVNCSTALTGLLRSAAGVRYLIERWEQLAERP